MFIVTDDPASPLCVSVRGAFKASHFQLRASPGILDYGNLAPLTRAQAVLRLTRNGLVPVGRLRPTSSDPSVEVADLSDRSLKDACYYAVTVRSPSGSGRVRHEIHFPGTGADDSIRVPVILTTRALVEVAPSSIFVGPDGADVSLLAARTDRAPLHLDRWDISGDFLFLRVEPVATDPQCRVRLIARRDPAYRGYVEGRLRLFFSDNLRVEVPVVGGPVRAEQSHPSPVVPKGLP